MLNNKVILINGISRSGSNILWNIIQSHPQVCSPVSETNHVLHPRGPGLHRISRFLYTRFANDRVRRYLDKKLYRAKLKNLNHEANKYRTEDQLYSLDEVRSAVLCLKALNEDIYLTDMFYSMYEDIHAIGLVRNGYAVCEGMVRRGERPDKVGASYARYMARIIEDSQRLENYRVVRFEEIIDRPFETAESLFRFCGVKPVQVDKLRFKSKEITSWDGSRSRTYQSVGGKYWFDRTSVKEFMDPDVDRSQSRLLSDGDRELFEKQAKPILEYLAYT